jgi:hypothetical protein
MARLSFRRRLSASLGVVVLVLLIGLLSGGLSAIWGSVVAGAAALRGNSGRDLVWHGGPVQHHPRLYLLFWGPAWQADPAHTTTKHTIETLFTSLAGGQYNNLLSQYGDNPRDPEAYVHNDVQVVGEWVDPVAPPAGTAITSWSVAQEVEVALAANPCSTGRVGSSGWCITPDDQSMVFAQDGTRYGGDLIGKCGMHASYLHGRFPHVAPVYYSQIRYPDSYTDGLCPYLLAAATHEYAETATDPAANTDPAWTADGGRSGTASEIGDLCQQQEAQPYTTTSATGRQTFAVAPLWDNGSHACALSRGREFWSPATGKHTAQGAILVAYQASDPTALGGPGGPLGYPTSEEHAILGGRQSAFEHGTISSYPATGRTVIQEVDGVESAGAACGARCALLRPGIRRGG